MFLKQGNFYKAAGTLPTTGQYNIYMEELIMFNYVWPLGLVVLSNVLYQICAKSVPEGMNPLASLTITYLIGAATSVILYYVLNKDANIITEYSKVNCAPFILGIVIVGLEVALPLVQMQRFPYGTEKMNQI